MSRVDNEIVSKKNSRSKMRKREDSVERGSLESFTRAKGLIVRNV